MPQRPILVVEDDFDVRDALTDALEDAGYPVLAARHGREALDLLEGEPPRLILLDLMMPVMDGYDFRRRQLEEPRYAEIPVVVLSADQAVARRSQEMGANGWLAKPVDFDRLLAEVSKYE